MSSWSRLPVELQVEILSCLPYPSTAQCRRLNHDSRAIVDAHRRRLRRRKVDRIGLSAEAEEWTLSLKSSEERKRKKFCVEAPGTSEDSDCDDAICGIPESLLSRIGSAASGSVVSVLNLNEMRLSSSDLSALSSSLSSSLIETLEISFCSLRGLDPLDLLRFMKSVSPKNIRLSWLRHVRRDFFSFEMIDFLREKEVLEVIYFTDPKGKAIKVPFSIETLLSSHCKSFHLDSTADITQESIDKLATAMAEDSELRRVTVETKLRPKIRNSRVTVISKGDRIIMTRK